MQQHTEVELNGSSNASLAQRKFAELKWGTGYKAWEERRWSCGSVCRWGVIQFVDATHGDAASDAATL